jgi:enoyl-CoA hydratase/carnithine racemase
MGGADMDLIQHRSDSMVAFENISYETQGAITYLTINRPKALNALNQATLTEIKSAWRMLATIASCEA